MTRLPGQQMGRSPTKPMVVQPDGVLDDEHGETVAIELEVGHGHSAYPDPVKATQPTERIHEVVDRYREAREVEVGQLGFKG